MEQLWLVPAISVLAGIAGALQRTSKAAFACMTGGVAAAALVGLCLIANVASNGPIANGWFFLDELSAFHLGGLLTVFLLSTWHSKHYFREDFAAGHAGLPQARLFAGLWCGALAAMSLVMIANNIGIMWVGIEATTLLTAFLICVHRTRQSLEAMWKYVLICSVGVAFAFVGTLLLAAAARGAKLEGGDALLWTSLREHAAALDPKLVKAAFIFLLVGYGAKAGLAPMHCWLPDAHSQAPSPVSALFSGFMLNTAFYCILRHVPIAEIATGSQGFSWEILRLIGLVSIFAGGIFLLFQRDGKRFLAYCSVENMGLIALGAGLGQAGVFAALYHTINHSLAKVSSFFAIGRLGQHRGGHDLGLLAGTLRYSPWWGGAALASFLALGGAVPFATFMSEFQILRAACAQHYYLTLALALAGAGLVFIAMAAKLIPLAWGETKLDSAEAAETRKTDQAEIQPPAMQSVTWDEKLLAVLPLAALAILCVWLPQPLADLMRKAAAIVAGGE